MTMSRGLAVIMRGVNASARRQEVLRTAGADMIEKIILTRTSERTTGGATACLEATQTTQLPSPEYGKLEHLAVTSAEDQNRASYGWCLD